MAAKNEGLAVHDALGSVTKPGLMIKIVLTKMIGCHIIIVVSKD